MKTDVSQNSTPVKIVNLGRARCKESGELFRGYHNCLQTTLKLVGKTIPARESSSQANVAPVNTKFTVNQVKLEHALIVKKSKATLAGMKKVPFFTMSLTSGPVKDENI